MAAALLVGAACLAPTLARAAGDDAGWYHEFVMKGSVIDVAEEGIYFCIGTPDGAKVGEEYDAIHVRRDISGHPRSTPRFKHVKVGRVRVEEIVDVHYAKAKVIEGKVAKGDIIALGKPEK
jgi:hypothetical protein